MVGRTLRNDFKNGIALVRCPNAPFFSHPRSMIAHLSRRDGRAEEYNSLATTGKSTTARPDQNAPTVSRVTGANPSADGGDNRVETDDPSVGGDWLADWEHPFEAPSQFLHRLSDPIIPDNDDELNSSSTVRRRWGWGSSKEAFRAHTAQRTGPNGDSELDESVHRMLEEVDQLRWIQLGFASNSSSTTLSDGAQAITMPMAGFAHSALERLREECPKVGVGVDMIWDDRDGGGQWWTNVPSTIAVAQSFVEFDELEAIIVPISLASASHFLSRTTRNGGIRSSLDLLASVSEYKALMPLYSVARDSNRPIVHLAGSIDPIFTATGKQNAESWEEVMWDLSLPSELEVNKDSKSKNTLEYDVFGASLALQSKQANGDNALDTTRLGIVQQWLEEGLKCPFTLQQVPLFSSPSSSRSKKNKVPQEILTAYSSTSSSISLLLPIQNALQDLLSPLPLPGRGIKSVRRELDLDFGRGDTIGDDREAREELERVGEGVGRMLEAYGWSGEVDEGELGEDE